MKQALVKVAALYVYPIKSCGAIPLTQVDVTERGLRYDRHWMVVTPDGLHLTQRELPRMALIKPKFDKDALVISAETAATRLKIPFDNAGFRCEVQVFGNRCEALDDGDAAARWFSNFLGIECRLVHMAADFVREVDQDYGRLEFADTCPILTVSEASLEDLNRRITRTGGEPLPISRFRPNIVVGGCDAYAEDEWAQVTINGLRFDLVRPTIRCPLPQVDQETAVKGKEPTRTLLSYRKISRTDVVFAQATVNLDTGPIAVGQDIDIKRGKESPKFVN